MSVGPKCKDAFSFILCVEVEMCLLFIHMSLAVIRRRDDRNFSNARKMLSLSLRSEVDFAFHPHGVDKLCTS